MTKPLPFTAAAVRRAIDGVRLAGLEVRAVSVAPDGTVTVHHIAPPVAPAPVQDETADQPWEFQA